MVTTRSQPAVPSARATKLYAQRPRAARISKSSTPTPAITSASAWSRRSRSGSAVRRAISAPACRMARDFEIDSNVGWGVGDNIYAGSVVVGGNASAIAGVALRGGEIVIKGNIGSRAGQVMKAGTLLCCGNASFLAGYMMYGGRIIILGDSGERVGEDMSGGAIFVGGRVQSLGADAKIAEMTAEDEASIQRIPAEIRRFVFEATFTEDRQRRHETALWRQRADLPALALYGFRWRDLLERQSRRGHPRQEPDRPLSHSRLWRVESGAAFRRYRAQDRPGNNSAPRRMRFATVNLATKIGDRNGAKPLDLSMPVLIAPMSYGALSKSTKIALARASRLAGIVGKHRRGRHVARAARGGGPADFPVPVGTAGLEHPRHAQGRRASRSISRKAPSPASAAS